MRITFVLAATIVFVGMAKANGPLQMWTVSSMHKVLRDDQAIGGGNPVIELEAARAGTADRQLVLLSAADVEVSKVAIEPLRTRGSRLILTPELLLPAYIQLPTLGKDYPDPLPPLKAPVKLKAGQAQPIWVSVHVPQSAAAGSYRGSMKLDLADGTTVRVPIHLTVWDFAIPVRPSMRTAFGLFYGYVAKQHKVKEDSAEFKRLKKSYYEMLVDHRISPYEIPVDLTDSTAGTYIDDPRVTSFVIPFSDDDQALGATVALVRKHGWFAKGLFYPKDEPVKKADYEALLKDCSRIKKLAPEAKIVSPFWRGPDFDKTKTPWEAFAGVLNVWCPISDYYTFAPARAKQKLGEEVMWYVCCGPRGDEANFFVEYEGIRHRILFWQQMKYGVEGLLYWCTTYWETTDDPWTDIASVKWIGKDVYGDGTLLYPGAKVGVDGPVSSIRLENIRDGMEDYEMLKLYEKRFGAVATEGLISRMVTDMQRYDRDPAKLEAIRREMAEAIEKG